MGLTNATFGMYGGLLAISLPQLLAEQHVPEPQIAAMTAAAMSPAFWAFLICPMLDVRFTRRFYASASAAIAAVMVMLAILNLHRLALLEGLLLCGFVSASITQNALGGWLSTAIPKEDESKLSAWFNVANIGGGGLIAMVAIELIHRVPLPVAGFLLGGALLLPVAIYPFIPVTLPDARLARDSFGQFFGEVLALVRRREVLVALAMFLLPSGSFTLTNILSGLGDEFHASMHEVSVVGGAGVALAGVVGSLVFPIFAKRMKLRPLYLTIGVVGACFTLSLLLLPRTPTVFALSLLGENVFQALAITGMFAIAFETIGQNNPLAATTFSVLGAASNFPIVYMEVVDGHAYAGHGITGEFVADAGYGILACVLLGVMLKLLPKAKVGTEAAA
jgi:PAT family beta-lactamase induction signal transducer AmpG